MINFINKNWVSQWETRLVMSILEFLEFGPFRYRLPINTIHFRYIDSILIFQPQNIKIENIAEKLNTFEPSINFTFGK